MAKYRKYEPSRNYMSGGGIGSAAGAILGSIIPGVGTAIGGSVGGMLGNIISPNKQEIQQPPRPIEPTMRFEMGGMLTPIEAGGSHSENGLGGVPIGNNASVEQGETMTEDFVYSDKLKINKTLAKEFSLPKSTIGKTFAQASKSLTIDQEDVISQRGNEKMLNRIAEAQEAYKQSFGDKYYQNEQPTVQMVHGGPHNPLMEGVGMQGLGMQDLMGTPNYLGGMPMGTMAPTPEAQTQVTPGFENRYGTFMDPNLQVQFEPQNPAVTPDATQDVTPNVIPAPQTTPAPSVTPQNQTTPEVVPEVAATAEEASNQASENPFSLNTNLFGNSNKFSMFNTPSLGFGQTQTFNPLDPFGLNKMSQGLNLKTGTTDTTGDTTDTTGDTSLGKAKFSPLRYAPIGADIYSLATAEKPKPMDASRYKQFGTFSENLVDRAQARKNIMDAASTTGEYMRESSGGNAALFSAMMQGADTRTQRTLGELSYQQDVQDAQEKARVEGLKNRQQAINSQIQQQVDIQNQQDMAAYNNMIQDSVANLAQNIGNVGTEQTRISQVNNLFQYDVHGQYKKALKEGTTDLSFGQYIQDLIGKLS